MESSLDPIDLLLLCTGNICRSPMAEALLRDRLARRGVQANVHSAGLLDAGEPASLYGVEVLATRGLDLSAHRSRTFSPEMLLAADLIIGMARLHVREAAVLVPEVWPRSFTLKELARRGEDVGARAPNQSLEEWLQKVHAGRSHAELLGDDHRDDIFDPMGSTRPVYERTAIEIAGLIDRLVALLFAQER